MTRIGFLGCGFIADLHAGLLAICDEPNTVHCAYDPDPQRLAAFTERWGSSALDSAATVIGACDAVFICTWTSEHADLVTQAAAKGCSIFCEKPLAFDSDRAARMLDTVSNANVVHMVGLVLRAAPALLALRAMVNDEASGRIVSIVLRDDQYLPIQGMYASTWRSDPQRAGRGVLLEHSIHDIDIIEWLAGPIDRVSGEEAYFHQLQPIEDAVHATMHLRSGASATLSTIWHDITSRPSQRRIEVFCERALYTLEGEWFGPLRWQRTAPNGEEKGCIEGEALTDWLDARTIAHPWPEATFLRAIQNGEPARPDFSDALRAHRVVDAIYRACRTQHAESVD